MKEFNAEYVYMEHMDEMLDPTRLYENLLNYYPDEDELEDAPWDRADDELWQYVDEDIEDVIRMHNLACKEQAFRAKQLPDAPAAFVYQVLVEWPTGHTESFFVRANNLNEALCILDTYTNPYECNVQNVSCLKNMPARPCISAGDDMFYDWMRQFCEEEN